MYTPKNMSLWERPENYLGPDWLDYYVFLVHHRDSNARDKSNFFAGLRLIGGSSKAVIVVRDAHWAVGWIEWIAIHKSGEKALRAADDVLEKNFRAR